jgi:hypothetical protein
MTPTGSGPAAYHDLARHLLSAHRWPASLLEAGYSLGELQWEHAGYHRDPDRPHRTMTAHQHAESLPPGTPYGTPPADDPTWRPGQQPGTDAKEPTR